MAVYRLGDMIRMRRETLGMTQEELIQIYNGKEEEPTGYFNCAWLPYRGQQSNAHGEENEICSLQVLRRIENGGVKRVKIDVFRQLMLKMGLLPERMYASLLVTDCRALSLKAEIHAHINMGEYEAAEKKLDELEGMLVPGYPRNEQYRMERRATIAYKKGEMEAREYLGILLDALRYTVPQLDEIDIAGWPFNVEEFDILFNIVNAYHSMKEREKEIDILTRLKKNVERQYMDRDHYAVWHMCVLAGLSQLMRLTEQYDRIIEYCEVGIEESKRQGILGNVHCFLYDIAWSRERMIKKGIDMDERIPDQQEDNIKKERACYRKQLVQGYYLSIAQGDDCEAERIKRLYNHNYPDAVKLL